MTSLSTENLIGLPDDSGGTPFTFLFLYCAFNIKPGNHTYPYSWEFHILSAAVTNKRPNVSSQQEDCWISFPLHRLQPLGLWSSDPFLKRNRLCSAFCAFLNVDKRPHQLSITMWLAARFCHIYNTHFAQTILFTLYCACSPGVTCLKVLMASALPHLPETGCYYTGFYHRKLGLRRGGCLLQSLCKINMQIYKYPTKRVGMFLFASVQGILYNNTHCCVLA